MALRIEDYALISNLQTGALVGKNGSIDWLCLPRFDSGACFAALLGGEEHGFWRIEPACPYRVHRQYREGTAILETVFETEHGAAVLTDGMIPKLDGTDLIRQVKCLRGEVPIRMDLVLRFDYGSLVPWIQYGARELMAIAGPDMVHIHSDVPLRGDNHRTEAVFSLKEGENVHVSLNWHPAHLHRPDPIRNPEKVLNDATDWWRAWSGKSKYEGRWKDAVHRSLITLKSLIHAPTGGIVAAPTTSLPEELGGSRNWDYRYCWLRDATFTLYSLLTAGYIDEARAWREWLLRAVAGMPGDIRIMYRLTGERRLTETTLDWLPGYEGSRPVRVGNAASQQLQLDVFGEVMDALHLARRENLEAKEESWELQRALLEHLESAWAKPDEGIWEVRGASRPFTHSKVMAWVAMDRGIKAIEGFGKSGPVDRWKSVREQIHREVCAEGYNASLNSFVQFYGSDRLDASLLMMPIVGFLPVSDPRLRGTVEAVERRLMRDGFVCRYSSDAAIEGLAGSEGTFLACSFWLVDNLALLGRREDALKLFERLLSIRNDVGLLAEEYEPALKRQVGNFPQAFSHVALINSARNLSQSGGPAQDRRGG